MLLDDVVDGAVVSLLSAATPALFVWVLLLLEAPLGLFSLLATHSAAVGEDGDDGDTIVRLFLTTVSRMDGAVVYYY